MGPGKPMPKMKAHVDTIAFSKAVGFELSSVIDVPGKKHDPSAIYPLGNDPYGWEKVLNDKHMILPSENIFYCNFSQTNSNKETSQILAKYLHQPEDYDWFADRELKSLKVPIEFWANSDNRLVDTRVIKDWKGQDCTPRADDGNSAVYAEKHSLASLAAVSASLEQPGIEKNKVRQNALKFEIPDWQKEIVDRIPVDMLDCISDSPHVAYQDLLEHSLLDVKGWSMAQRYAFRKMVEGARKENGRYVIPMVMNNKIKIFSKKENVDAILRHAENFLKSSDKKQKKNQGYHDEVVKYFSYMEEADILEDIPEDELKSTNCYYLAWFSVETGCGPDGKGKFRIVMDASGKVDNVSLNDCLFSTPEITSSIFNSAFAFRHKKFVVTADIKKMFFQFIIPEEQRNYLRILVHEDLDPCKPIVHKRFKRDPFGVSQAGVIALLRCKTDCQRQPFWRVS